MITRSKRLSTNKTAYQILRNDNWVTKAILLLPFFMLAGVANSYGEENSSEDFFLAFDTTVANLIVAPKKYMGTHLWIAGVFRAGKEYDRLYLTEEHAAHGIVENSIILDNSYSTGLSANDRAALEMQYVRVNGQVALLTGLREKAVYIAKISTILSYKDE